MNVLKQTQHITKKGKTKQQNTQNKSKANMLKSNEWTNAKKYFDKFHLPDSVNRLLMKAIEHVFISISDPNTHTHIHRDQKPLIITHTHTPNKTIRLTHVLNRDVDKNRLISFNILRPYDSGV